VACSGILSYILAYDDLPVVFLLLMCSMLYVPVSVHDMFKAYSEGRIKRAALLGLLTIGIILFSLLCANFSDAISRYQNEQYWHY
jgi:putative effector of murein hydrolase LrgA (UPF0299 family)